MVNTQRANLIITQKGIAVKELLQIIEERKDEDTGTPPAIIKVYASVPQQQGACSKEKKGDKCLIAR